jgi:Flp pilus assembly protein TadB
MLSRDDERRLREIERRLVTDDPLLERRLRDFQPRPGFRMPRLWIRWIVAVLCTLAAAALLGRDPAVSIGMICAVTVLLTWWIPRLLR